MGAFKQVAEPVPDLGAGIRLQKRMAELGLASRRGAEVLIVEGRVRVNGAVVAGLGSRVLPTDRVEVDAAVESGPNGFLLNKPAGYVTTKGSEEGPGIMDLLPPTAADLSYAGRLDKDSRGLVLLLRDGRLNQALTAPETHLEKEYRVTTTERPSDGQLEKMGRGLVLNDGPTRPCRIERCGDRSFRVWLSQGRKRQVRRMASKLGLDVADLRREAIGPLRLGSLAEGAWRELSASEEKILWDAVRKNLGDGLQPSVGRVKIPT
ncbi:MAG: pseudouridine synthase [bacterium]